MAKYRKKPDSRTFEPVQFRGQMTVNDLEAAGGCLCLEDGKGGEAHLHTIHAGQIVHLEEGDWIMPEPDGKHFYPIKPDIFEATYEQIEG